MTQMQLGKVWFVVSVVLLYYALNSWIVTQGGNEVFGTKLIVSQRVTAAMVAIPVCTILLVVSSLVGRFYALRAEAHWHARVPVVGFGQIETASREGRIYQASMLFLFSILPILALAHFWSVFTTAKVMRNDGSNRLLAGIWDWSGLYTLNDPARICSDFTAGRLDPCVGNATILPGLQPSFFAGLTFLAPLSVAAHWRALVRK